MKEINRDDLKIYGNMSLGGGKYKNVIIHGNGDIQSDLTAAELKVNGSGSFSGNVKADTAKINGSGKITGNADISSLSIYGSLKIISDLKSDAVKSHGELTVTGSITAGSIDIHGELKSKNNCNADVINCYGQIKVGNELIADDIMINLYGKSTAGEIGGENIKIKRYPENKITKFLHAIFLMELFKEASMKTDTIEGDEIYLECTKAQVVRGKKVTIGAGCEIEYVEYSESLIKNEKAVVKKEKKI